MHSHYILMSAVSQQVFDLNLCIKSSYRETSVESKDSKIGQGPFETDGGDVALSLSPLY